MPLTSDDDRASELNEKRRKQIFKVVKIVFWLIAIILMSAFCLIAAWVAGYIH